MSSLYAGNVVLACFIMILTGLSWFTELRDPHALLKLISVMGALGLASAIGCLILYARLEERMRCRHTRVNVFQWGPDGVRISAARVVCEDCGRVFRPKDEELVARVVEAHQAGVL